jgi:hypothetical protein
MDSEHNLKAAERKEISLSLSLGEINKILAALGNLPYVQVYELIQEIREQTEMELDPCSQLVKTANQKNGHSKENS